MATHHLEEVAPSTTHAALLRAGRVVAAGPVEDVLVASRLRECFGISLDVARRDGRWSATGRP
jgi:iron complex transport system ATP-binding protein